MKLSCALMKEPLQIPNVVNLPAMLNTQTSARQKAVELTLEGTHVTIITENISTKTPVKLFVPKDNFRALVPAD
jgi:hypothetical protein